ncbi:MAG: ZIP family metal transporter [Proteobacteria bacterium]|nr:ZIP family metal transporter [Pseudomonadota bacterium]
MPLLPLILFCAALGGIASAAFAVVFLWVSDERSARILPHFVSFATGALLAAALLALLPEAIEGLGADGAHRLGVTLVAGLVIFFLIEKTVLWWHRHHHHDHAHVPHAADAREHASGILVLIGDSIHNALDGVIIAAAFLNDRTLGWVTTFAVAAHEIPHRVGDFGILVNAGMSRQRALWLNLATGLASLGGALGAYFALGASMGFLPYALAFAAAGFLYVAVAGLIPGLQRRADPRTSVTQVSLMTLGIVAVYVADAIAH